MGDDHRHLRRSGEAVEQAARKVGLELSDRGDEHHGRARRNRLQGFFRHDEDAIRADARVLDERLLPGGQRSENKATRRPSRRFEHRDNRSAEGARW
jgi:hypothetical protein